MRTALSLSILGFLFLVVPMQAMAGTAPGYPINICGVSFNNYDDGLCTGSVDGCPTGTTVINCSGGICNGTDGDDCILGSANADIINAGKGNDFICGYGGADWIKASYGSDFVCGGADADVIEGGWGRDRVNGESGDDTIDAGQCDDYLYGGASGADVCKGGQGRDNYDPDPPDFASSCETWSQGQTASQTGANCPTPPVISPYAP